MQHYGICPMFTMFHKVDLGKGLGGFHLAATFDFVYFFLHKLFYFSYTNYFFFT